MQHLDLHYNFKYVTNFMLGQAHAAIKSLYNFQVKKMNLDSATQVLKAIKYG